MMPSLLMGIMAWTKLDARSLPSTEGMVRRGGGKGPYRHLERLVHKGSVPAL
jgi:hypothetical protein